MYIDWLKSSQLEGQQFTPQNIMLRYVCTVSNLIIQLFDVFNVNPNFTVEKIRLREFILLDQHYTSNE